MMEFNQILFSKTYSMKIKQPLTNKYSNIPNTSKIIFESGVTDSLKVEEGFISNILYSEETDSVFINEDICAEYIDNSSREGISVPKDNLRFLLKNPESYEYLKNNPLSNINMNINDFLNLDGLNFTRDNIPDYLRDREVFGKKLLIMNSFSEDMSEDYICYSFPFGGISKSTPYFFAITFDNKFKILEIDDFIKIDYLEGNLYLAQNNEQVDLNNISFIGGYFNLEPIRLIPKNPINLKRTISNEVSFSKIINISDKNLVNINVIDSSTVAVSFTTNCYIFPNLQDIIKIDGVSINFPIFIKKNEIILITYNLLSIPNSFGVEKELKLLNYISAQDFSVRPISTTGMNSETSLGIYVRREIDYNVFHEAEYYIPLFTNINTNT